MIYAISSTGNSLKSIMDIRFGKCKYIVLFDSEKKIYSIEENPTLSAPHSGIKLVEFIQEKGATVVITGEVGPMVSSELEKRRMQLILLHEDRIKIDQILDYIEKRHA